METAIFALAGTMLGILGTLAVTWISAHHESKRHSKGLTYTAATEYFKQACEMARHSRGNVAPLHHFLIHTAVVTAMVDTKKITAETVEAILKEIDEVSKKVSMNSSKSS